MRIGVLTSSFPSAPGDPAGAFVAEHARWLRDQGASVDVVAARPGPLVAEPGLQVARLPFGARVFGAEGAPEVLAQKKGLPQALAVSVAMLAAAARRRRRWDRVVAHWLVPAGLAAAAIAEGRPLRVIAHSGDVHLLRRLCLVPFAAAALARAGARISFVSEGLRELFLRDVRPRGLRARIANAAEVTPMGVEVERFRRAAREPSSGGGPVAFLGRLVPIKGCDIAVAAAGLWRAPATLAIAGAGPEAERLRAQAAPLGAKVRFRGELRGKERDRFVADASALLLPSRELSGGRSEGLPVAALEAMAAGVPVIASAVGGLAELPEDVAVRIPAEDPRALARAVDRVLGDEGERARRVSAAAEFVKGRDWSAVGPRLS